MTGNHTTHAVQPPSGKDIGWASRKQPPYQPWPRSSRRVAAHKTKPPPRTRSGRRPCVGKRRRLRSSASGKQPDSVQRSKSKTYPTYVLHTAGSSRYTCVPYMKPAMRSDLDSETGLSLITTVQYHCEQPYTVTPRQQKGGGHGLPTARRRVCSWDGCGRRDCRFGDGEDSGLNYPCSNRNYFLFYIFYRYVFRNHLWCTLRQQLGHCPNPGGQNRASYPMMAGSLCGDILKHALILDYPLLPRHTS